MSDVDRYIEAIPELRRERFLRLMKIIQAANPAYEPWLAGSPGGIIGFGRYRYEYPSGRTGESMQLGLASRAKYIAIYATCADVADEIAPKFKDRLPRCKIGKSCIEVPDNAPIDDGVIAELTQAVAESFQTAMSMPKEPGRTYIWE
jgi:hypothetical protein